jgi:hypothetical protein
MRLAGFVVPLMMVAACDTTMSNGEDASPARGGAAAAPGTGAVALALLPSSAEGMTAAASGRLALRGRCLVLEGGGETVQLAFATADTSWDASAAALRVGTRTFALGTRLEIGGGEFTGNAAALPWLRRPAAECGTDRFWIVSSIGPA